mgnify:CR=1 FL=1
MSKEKWNLELSEYIEKLNLKLDVGTEDAALTAIITGIGSIFLSNLIGKNIKNTSITLIFLDNFKLFIIHFIIGSIINDIIKAIKNGI